MMTTGNGTMTPEGTPAKIGRTSWYQTIAAIPLLLGLAFATPMSAANGEPGRVCDLAAVRAAADFGVPPDIMLAITRVETGRMAGGMKTPWPWTLNMGGRGHWLPDRNRAADLIRERAATGRQDIDIGCFQINLRWHGNQFRDPLDLLDPGRNARYAARFLSDLFNEFGDWSLAAGAYHSRNAGRALTYRKKVQEERVALTGSGMRLATVPPAVHPNAYPFMKPNMRGAVTRGSLVPVTDPAFSRPALIGG